MTLDAYDLAKMLAPSSDGAYLKSRFGTIKRAHSDGTADVLIDGSTTPQRLADWSGAPAGSRCVIAMKDRCWFVLSATSAAGSGPLLAHPVDSIYLSLSETSPAELFGGTWTAFGAGRALIGFGSNGSTSYTTAGATGGSDSVALSVSQMPSHRHSDVWDHGSGSYGANAGGGAYATWFVAANRVSFGYWISSHVGGGGKHENRMPYIVVYMWRRIA